MKKKLPYEQALDLCFSYLQKRKFLHLDLSLWNYRSKQQDSYELDLTTYIQFLELDLIIRGRDR